MAVFRTISRSLLPAALAAMLGLSACGPATLPQGDTINDRAEAQNRAIHEVNRAIDRAFVRPASTAYGIVIPAPIRTGIGNVSSNLNQPGYVINNLLQIRLGQASQNILRFAINTTLGIGGVFDPATALGVPEADTNFGETMHIWGAPEGQYVELPVVGASTSRDTIGLVVDTAMNPMRHIFEPPESDYTTGVGIASRFGDRYRYSDFIDSILYESADSYAQARLLYLQNRRFELGGNAGGADYLDPYDDPYLDPYEDTDAQ